MIPDSAGSGTFRTEIILTVSGILDQAYPGNRQDSFSPRDLMSPPGIPDPGTSGLSHGGGGAGESRTHSVSTDLEDFPMKPHKPRIIGILHEQGRDAHLPFLYKTAYEAPDGGCRRNG